MNSVQHQASENGFENIRQEDEQGREFWYARDLAPILDYPVWRNFAGVIEKAKQACDNSGHAVADHFDDVVKMVGIGSGAHRRVEDVKLSRYACYLIVQNGNPSKPVIAAGQTYFALQTRRQELQDQAQFTQLSEDDRRLMLRNELARHNKDLAAAAQQCGVITPLDYAVFQDHGYKGLYGGLGAKEIHARKSLKKSQKILDHMGSTELAANLFRATQAEEKLRREGAQGKAAANRTHLEVGRKVRQTIQELGGTMPENLPPPDKSIQQLTREQQKRVGKKAS
ncbi:DNA damage-inducible protein D [Hydrogenophaga sp. BPS33]|uniref:DNA damage-inducible protein D n=1 Tax=Hydrogenophaga sp. BPS33 TaxID=2651974 RepID=UPI0013200416|nr:DNA damage-inducible protein D [Hydrogenophaga sp. BPS33]QHE83450.1 DNA damage-inducible protein D [Hydrogenophaga sp. BPS33]